MRINSFTPDANIFNFQGNNTIQRNSNLSFGDMLKEKLDAVNQKQIEADNMTNKFVKGEDVEIHEVMLAAEEAKMSLQLAVQIRNSMVEAVKELTSMQL